MAAAVHQRAARPDRLPSCLSWMRTVTIRSRASATPTGRIPALPQARAQRVDLVLRQRRGACRSRCRATACCLSVSPVAAWRCGSRLSSSAAIWLGSNFGCGFGGSAFFGGGSRLSAASSDPASWLSFFSASAIGSIFGSGSLSKACFGSGFGGCGRRLRLGLLRLGLRRLHLIGGRDDLLLLDDLGVRLLDRLRLGDLLDQRLRRFGLRRGLRCPCVICEKSVAEMMSTGSEFRRRRVRAAWSRT